MRKLSIFVIIILSFLVLLPIWAVFALGNGDITFLNLHNTAQVPYASLSTEGLYEGPLVPGDSYAWGNCTYWVYYLRLEAGDAIPTNWGNAASWAYFASREGYEVDHTPSPGAIMQTANSDQGLGHVAYVVKVDKTNGAWTISEMNVKGLDVVDTNTLPASYAVDYNFIHDKGISFESN